MDQITEFSAKYNEDLATQILEGMCDAAWRGEDSFKVTYIDADIDCSVSSEMINASNHILSGSIYLDDDEWCYSVESGDNNGTVIHEWCREEDYQQYDVPPPVQAILVPQDDFLKQERPEMYKVYLAWKKLDWFTEMQRSYNYDRMFAPGLKTEGYWKAKAAEKGLKFEFED